MKRTRLPTGKKKQRKLRLPRERVEKVIVDFWQFAEDPEKWGVELYKNEDDDDPFVIYWYKTKEKADKCADYFMPKK